MKDVYLVAAKRSAFGTYLGKLSQVPLAKIGSDVVKGIFDSYKISPSIIDEVIIGNVLSSGLKQNIARQIAINAGISDDVCATTVNMMCASGMKALFNGYLSILAGVNDVVLTGGVEQMSSAPLLVSNDKRSKVRFDNSDVVDSLLFDGLIDAFSGEHMGIITERLNKKYNISRDSQDLYAHNSHQKAILALNKGLFENEIIPVLIDGELFSVDQQINFNSNLEKMKTLRSVFDPNGTISAANASGINDGVSFVILASHEAVVKHNLVPLAKIVATAQVGIAPDLMGLGPVVAINKILEDTNLSLEQMDLIEINEAFALQVLAVIKELSVKHNISYDKLLSKINKNGGAIALGHPIGASGSRIVVSLLNQLLLNPNAKYGLASLCVGGGMGTAIIIEKL